MKIISAVFKACLLLAVILSLSSCNLDSAVGIDGAEINEKGELIPRDTPYAALVESNVNIVVQYSRLDTSEVEMALMTTMAYPVD